MSLEEIALNTSISEVINREDHNWIDEGIKRFQKYGFRNSFEKLTDYAGKLISNLNYKSKETIKNLVSKSSDKEKQKLVERYQKRGGKGFTLIELLTVMVIIGILAGLLIPVIGGVKEKAYISGCAFNLKNIGTALTMYAIESEATEGAQYFPYYASVNTASLGLLKTVGYIQEDSIGIFRCLGENRTRTNPLWYTPKPTTIILTDNLGLGTSSDVNEPGMSWSTYLITPIIRNSGQNVDGKTVNSSFPLVWDWYSGIESNSEGTAFQRSLLNHNYKGGNILFAGSYVKFRSSKVGWGSGAQNNTPDSDQ